jgi:hypothetical protein
LVRPFAISPTTQRTDAAHEDLILEVRSRLKSESDLGFFGAEAILASLRARGVEPRPAERTVSRILRRRGVLDGRHRVRWPPPPPGWYLREVARRRRELDSVDVVEGLVIKGGPQVEVRNAVALQGGLVASWPRGERVTAKFVVECLVEHWRQFGLPGYAQFDYDTVFQGPHVHPDVVGRVSRLCLAWASSRCSCRPASRASSRPSRTPTVPGRRRSGAGSSMWTWTPWPIDPAALSRRCGVTGRTGSRRHRSGARSRSIGG